MIAAATALSATYGAAVGNAFVDVIGAPGAAADGTTFSVTGDSVNVSIVPKPGWRLTSPASQSLGPGESGYWSVVSLLKEDDAHGYICHPSVESTSNHVHAPVVSGEVHVGGPCIYAAPSNGCFCTLSGESSMVAEGVHAVTNVIHTCPGTDIDEVVITGGESHVGTEFFEWTWPGGHTNGAAFRADDIWIRHGTNSLGAALSVTNDACKLCKASFATNVEVVASKLSVSCPPYLGIDRTDEMRGMLQTRTASASLDPEQPDVGGFEWACSRMCEFGVSNGMSFEYGTMNSEACSMLFNDQEIAVSVGGATAKTNFTIVRVDVQIGDVDEANEEERGEWLYWIPDDPGGEFTEEGTNALVDVSVVCEPVDGAMASTSVRLDFPEHLLFVLEEDGTYTEAKKTYLVKDLGKKRFRLHGHRRSEKYLGDEIVVTHEISGAVDKAKFTVFGRPWLIPDYDRDGEITKEKDEPKAKDGRTIFRFWTNNDDDETKDNWEWEGWLPISYADGSINENSDNQPRHDADANSKDDRVDGYSDLLDFTPVAIDASEVFPNGTPQTLKDKVRFSLKSDCVNVVWTGLGTTEANVFLTQKAECYGENLKSYQYEAKVCNIKKETEVHKELTKRLLKKEKVVVLIEGLEDGEKFTIEVKDDKESKLSAGALKLKVSNVEHMYRWMDLRHAGVNLLSHSGMEDVGDLQTDSPLFEPANTECNEMKEPENGPDSDCNGIPRDGRHFVFIHGYNINSDEARAWGAEMYKRLWQSGMNSKFTVVDWVGDAGQFGDRDDGTSISYHFAVPNAFFAAQALKEQVAANIGNNAILMAHSLGNMVASSAIADWNLKVEKYYLLNAAVARQAYVPRDNTDAGVIAEDELMIDDDWKGVLKKYWASYWYTNFKENDFRSQLKWVGTFGKINGAVNCFSPTDDIIHNIEQPMFGPPSLGSVWTMQEKLKGTFALRAANFLATSKAGEIVLKFFADGLQGELLHTEAGWGVNFHWGGREYLAKWSSDVNDKPFDELVREPLFLPFTSCSEKMNSPEPFLFKGSNWAQNMDQYFLRAKLLGCAIPATSFAAGANSIDELPSQTYYEYEANWPRHDSRWCHSDLKNVAYYFNSKFFDAVVDGLMKGKK